MELAEYITLNHTIMNGQHIHIEPMNTQRSDREGERER